jgi:polar amino acid transport system permease protein
VDPTPEAASSEAAGLFSTRRFALTGRRGLLASSLSSALVTFAFVGVLFVAPGGATVRHYFFSPHAMKVAFLGDPAHGLSSVGMGILTNIWMFLLCEVLVLALGLLVAWTRISQSPVLLPFRAMAVVYTDVMRGVPLLLVVLIIGFGLPGLYLRVISYQSPAVYGCVALVLSYGAYIAEVIRAGIYSVPHGQILAARSLGLTHPTTMRRVILPQALRTVVPPLLNDFISLQKDTALVSVLGAVEATRAAQIYNASTFNASSYVVAALLFLALTIPLTRFADRLLARDRARRLAGAT